MAEAPAQRDVPRSIVTFEDVCIHFTREEWDLLDEHQKFLHCEAMLENFMLVISLGLSPGRSLYPKEHFASGWVAGNISWAATISM
uniref:KRAB domain-containing protein n=1 Tax=Phocoena sinus TaxID=42100 RepID=A0A8C9CME8_PHOSS